MAISDTIQSMYENVGDVYDTITNVTLPEHKNIENIPRTIRDSYLEIINNGINVIYDNWEKVTGEGTSLTLTPTEEAPMKIVYKGNTSQDTITNKNLLNYTLDILKTRNTSGTWSGNVYSYNGITYTINDDLTIKVNGTASANSYFYITKINDIYYKNMAGSSLKLVGCPSGGSSSTYRLVFLSDNWLGGIDAGSGSQFSVQDTYYNQAFIQVYNGTQIQDAIFKPMLTTDTTLTYNDYVYPTAGQGSPSPDYPQEIQVVSGDNSINIEGKNYLDTSSFELGFINASGYFESSNVNALFDYIEIEPNKDYTYLFSGSIVGTRYIFYTENKTFISRSDLVTTSNTIITSPSNAKYLRIYINKDNQTMTQEKVNALNMKLTDTPYTGASYPINLPEGMFLGWIPNTTYQDKIDKSTGKNLTNIDDYLGGNVGSNGLIRQDDHITSFTNTNGVITFTTDLAYRGTYSDYIQVEPSTNYYISFDKLTTGVTYFGFYNWYDESKTFISRDNVSTPNRTSPSNAKYCVMFLGINEVGTAKITNIMLNKGTTSLPYEPYGTSWYLKKEIGKGIWETFGEYPVSYTNIKPFRMKKPTDSLDYGSAIACPYVFESGIYSDNNDNWDNANLIGKLCNRAEYNYLWEIFDTSATLEQVQTKLNGKELYYPLKTPTYTLIEGELLNQLEAIKMSYEGQTNLSQTNNDLPFILNPSALKKV